jgi:hypothetical protein
LLHGIVLVEGFVNCRSTIQKFHGPVDIATDIRDQPQSERVIR